MAERSLSGLKILHLISSVDPANGGPVEGIKQLAAAGKSFGEESEVVCLDSPEAAFLSEFPLPVYALGPSWGRYSFNRNFVPWLRENARRYDIVVADGIWQYHSFGAWRALRGSSTPYVVYTHGMLDPWFKRTYPLKHLKKWLYWPWAEYRVLRDAGAVLFTCEEERLLARESFSLYRCNEVVVNYGTAGPSGDRNTELASFYEVYPELRGKRLITFMGRLHPKKGPDLLVRAFARTMAKFPDWHLVMAGPDQTGWSEDLRSIAQEAGITDRITWTGMISGAVKWGALRASSAFILPSHQENFGIVVAEALACGVPVLISNKVNIWREIEQDGSGFVENDDLEGTIALLSRWMNASEMERQNMQAQARKCFERRFEIGQAARSLTEALKTVIGNRAEAARAAAGI